MIKSSTIETRYVSSDFEPFLDLGIEPTQCKSSYVFIASPIIWALTRQKQSSGFSTK